MHPRVAKRRETAHQGLRERLDVVAISLAVVHGIDNDGLMCAKDQFGLAMQSLVDTPPRFGRVGGVWQALELTDSGQGLALDIAPEVHSAWRIAYAGRERRCERRLARAG